MSPSGVLALLMISGYVYAGCCSAQEDRQTRTYLEDCSVFDPDRPRRPTITKSEAEDQFKCHVSQEGKERLGKLESENLLLENQVARLEGNSALGEEELRREVELVKGQLGKQLTWTVEEKALRAEETRQLLINLETATSVEVSKVKESSRGCRVAAETEGAEAKGRLEDVEGTLRRLAATLDRKTSVWKLGGQTAFNASQAMGGWRLSEVLKKDGRYPLVPCAEYIFNLTGSTIEQTWRSGKSGAKSEEKRNLTVDTHSPHQWISTGGWRWTWVTTDYAKWAVLMACDNKDLSFCVYLYLLSRERTLRPATLEMLRNVAEQRGFPKADGVLVDQTSC